MWVIFVMAARYLNIVVMRMMNGLKSICLKETLRKLQIELNYKIIQHTIDIDKNEVYYLFKEK